MKSMRDRSKELAEQIANMRTPFNAGGELAAEAIMGYIRRLEDDLADDEQLAVVSYQGPSPMQVTEVAFPSARTLVLIGRDGDGNEVHHFGHVSTVQLEMKIVPRDPDEERTEIGFHTAFDDE